MGHPSNMAIVQLPALGTSLWRLFALHMKNDYLYCSFAYSRSY